MNKQRVLSLVLALVMVLGAFGVVYASETNKSGPNDNKIQWLVDNEVVVGRKVNKDSEKTDLDLDKKITRAEVTKLIVYTLGKQDLADKLDGVMKPFPDVTLEHWANGFISVAATERINKDNTNGIIIGYEDGEFKPERDVTYAELAAMLVRIAKKDLTKKMEDQAIWATDYLRWADELGILDGIKITDSNKAIDRYDAFVMIYNAMKAIGRVDKNDKINFGEVMGIVSKAQAGKIQLNQDKDKEYKLTWNTRYTDGTTLRDVADNAVRPGSLVRLIANKDGEVEFLIELGNPRVGAQPATRWFDVAKKVASTKDFGGRPAAARDAYFLDEYFKQIVVDGVQADIKSNTRFFIADVNKNYLKEVDSLNEVFKLYLRDWRELNQVYMGYDEFADGKIREAKVIVFGQVDKYNGKKDVRRITNFYNTKYSFSAEDTKGVQTRYDLSKTDYFPRSEYVDVMDVVRIYHIDDVQTRKGSDKGTANGLDLLIDYSKDPVFRVVELDIKDRLITLRDKFDREREFVLDADIFLEGQLKKGSHVQISLNAAQTKIEVVSVVDKDLKGAVPTGVRVGQQRGYVTAFREVNPNVYALTVAKWDKDVGFYGHEALYLHISDLSDRNFLDNQLKEYKNVLQAYDANANGRLDRAEYQRYLDNTAEDARKYFEIVFDVDKQFGGTDFAYNFEKYEGVGNKYKTKTGVPGDYRWPIDADARVSNRSNRPLTVVSVNGVKLSTPRVIQPNSYAEAYVNNAGNEVKFRTNDKVVLQAPCTDAGCDLESFVIKADCGGTNEVKEDRVCQLENRSNCCGQNTSVCHAYECAVEVELGCLTEVEAKYREKEVEKLEVVVRKDACADCEWYVKTNWDNISSVEIVRREVRLEPGTGKLRVDLTIKGKNGVKIAEQNSNPAVYKDQVNYTFFIPVGQDITACTDVCEFREKFDIRLNVPCGYDFVAGTVPVQPVQPQDKSIKLVQVSSANTQVGSFSEYKLQLTGYPNAKTFSTYRVVDGARHNVLNKVDINTGRIGRVGDAADILVELFDANGNSLTNGPQTVRF